MRPDTVAALTAAQSRDIRTELGLRPIINVAGTMTVLGASIMVPQAVAAMAAMAGEFVEMDQLHAAASRVIARSGVIALAQSELSLLRQRDHAVGCRHHDR